MRGKLPLVPAALVRRTILPETSSKSTKGTTLPRMPTFKPSNLTKPVRRTSSVENVTKSYELRSVNSPDLNHIPFWDFKSVVPGYGAEIGLRMLTYAWSVTSRCEDPGDFSDGQRVTLWLTKSERNVMTVDAVRPGSQCTELAVEGALGRVGPSQDQLGEGSGVLWSPDGNSDASGRW
jgi:hypothetical protein